jgi:hypothetical protein
MTLDQRNYAVNAVLADIGWISDEEKKAVKETLEDGIVHFTPDFHELHLYWPVIADTMDDAFNQARATLRTAAEATGVPIPRTTKIQVCELG